MFLLTDLTEIGYLQIKNDKEILIRKIQEYQSIINELDLALPFLSSIYEPKIIVRNLSDRHFEGITIIPYNNEKIRISVRLSKDISKFSDEEDPYLFELLEKMIKEKIREKFPTHFNNPYSFSQDDEGKY